MKQFFQDENGATAVEYALVLAGIILVIIGVMSSLSSELYGLWEKNAFLK